MKYDKKTTISNNLTLIDIKNTIIDVFLIPSYDDIVAAAAAADVVDDVDVGRDVLDADMHIYINILPSELYLGMIRCSAFILHSFFYLKSSHACDCLPWHKYNGIDGSNL